MTKNMMMMMTMMMTVPSARIVSMQVGGTMQLLLQSCAILFMCFISSDYLLIIDIDLDLSNNSHF